jgi:hypothetical protein
MLHDILTPLLFKREELRSIPRSKIAADKEGLRVTIASSPLYAEAVKKCYAQYIRNLDPLTPPPTNPRVRPQSFLYPSPLAARSSSSTPSQSEKGGSSVEFADVSEVQVHSSPIPACSSSSGTTTSKAGESIVNIIDLSEDHHDVLIWAIVWVSNGSKYRTALLLPKTNQEGQFSLKSLKSELDKKVKVLETYDPLAENWRELPWDTTVGPLHYDGRVILFRAAGVTELRGFDRVKNIAARLSGSKGKSHAR